MIHNVLGALRSITILNAAVTAPTWLDGHDGGACSLLTVENGLLDLDAYFAGHADCLLPHSPFWFCSTKLPHEFDASASCPIWLAFLHQIFEGDAERIAIMQEWFGYCLTPDTTLQKFLMLVGVGANGKGVLCAVLTTLLGVENCSFVPLELFGDRFQLTQSIGKLVNIAPECGDIDRIAEGVLKSFTVGDLMQMDRKYRTPVQVAPTARFVLPTNNRPRFSDRSSGLWRRLILMHCRVVIPEADRIPGMDKPEYWRHLGELPGILNWALAPNGFLGSCD